MDLVSTLREHAGECDLVAIERAASEGLYAANTTEWAYAQAFRSAAAEIERLRSHLAYIRYKLWERSPSPDGLSGTAKDIWRAVDEAIGPMTTNSAEAKHGD